MPTFKLSLQEGLSPKLVDRLHDEVLTMGRAAGIDATMLRVAALVAEEVCTNILEYSKASWIEVSLAKADGKLVVRVGDDGVPFNAGEAILAQRGLKLQDVQDGKLGLYIVNQLASSVRCALDAQGKHRVDFEFLDRAPVGRS